MASRIPWGAHQCTLDETVPPAKEWVDIGTTLHRPIMAFADDADDIVYLHGVAPDGLSGTLTLRVCYMMATATTGTVDVGAAVEAVSDGDTDFDLQTASGFDTVNTVANTTVPGTAGNIDIISITLTNNDGMAAGDSIVIEFRRDASEDDASGDMQVLWWELRDTA